MRIYLDGIFLLNFLVDYLLLFGTNRLAGFPPGRGRCAGAALVGAVYGAACLLPGLAFLGRLPWRLVFLGWMGLLAFGWNVSAVKRTGIFVILAMALGGAAVSAGSGNFVSLILTAAGVWLLCAAAFGEGIGGREYIPVKIGWKGKQLTLTAMRDTGNTLRDPVTGEQVLVMSPDAAGILTGLTRQELKQPLETLEKAPIPGLRLIPYRSVGQVGGFMLAMRFPDVIIGKHRRSAIVAFAPEGLGEGSAYQILAGGSL